MLACRMMWIDDQLCERMPLERLEFQKAISGLHLSTGSTLFCRAIRAQTIKAYCYSVAMLLLLFHGVDGRKDHASDRNMRYILTQVYVELDRFEQVPNRRKTLPPTFSRSTNQRGRRSENPTPLQGVRISLLGRCLPIGWQQEVRVGPRRTQ